MLKGRGLESGDGVTDMQKSAGVARDVLIGEAGGTDEKLKNCNLVVEMKNDKHKNCFQILSALLQGCFLRGSEASSPSEWAFDQDQAEKNLPRIRVLLLTILANIDQTEFEKMAEGATKGRG
ncbi:unnamed protein product [Amoebophrya sp. A25]|nr:unnamed protein product [Amoebophrya sp. A25]|eukprot:GSA25T00012003001.1